MRLTFVLTVVFALAAGGAYSAEREGFLIGFGLGGGALDCEPCESTDAFAFTIEIGGSVGQDLALLADAVTVSHRDVSFVRGEASKDFISYQLLAAVRYWPTSRLWVQGGVGFGWSEEQTGNVSVSGPARLAFGSQAGVELLQRGKFALDLRIRYGRTSSRPAVTHVVGVLGLTWY